MDGAECFTRCFAEFVRRQFSIWHLSRSSSPDISAWPSGEWTAFLAIRRSRRPPQFSASTLTAAASPARTDSVSAIIAQGPARPQFLRIPHCSGFRQEVLPARNCIAVSRPLDCFTSLRHRYGAQGEQRYHRSDRELVHVCSRGIGNSRVRSRRKNGDPSGCLPNAKPIGPAAQSSRLVHALVQFPNSCSPAVYCDELDGRAQTINSGRKTGSETPLIQFSDRVSPGLHLQECATYAPSIHQGCADRRNEPRQSSQSLRKRS